MSESSPSQSALSGAAHFANPPEYRLADDLARLCLPQEWRDACRTLAWVNSVCLLFLVVGLVGLKPPKVIHRPLKEVVEITAQIYTPPQEPPKTQPDVKPDEPEPPPDNPEDIPQVAPIVAAADPSAVAFAVPVQGAVAVANAAQIPTAPPRELHTAPAKPTMYIPGSEAGDVTPKPDYPMMAARRQIQGTVMVEIKVDTSGNVSSAEVQKSSGSTILDDAAVDVVKRRWHFPAGRPRWLLWPCVFKLE
jgi:TonB family protein